jgi:hypothetical protein
MATSAKGVLLNPANIITALRLAGCKGVTKLNEGALAVRHIFLNYDALLGVEVGNRTVGDMVYQLADKLNPECVECKFANLNTASDVEVRTSDEIISIGLSCGFKPEGECVIGYSTRVAHDLSGRVYVEKTYSSDGKPSTRGTAITMPSEFLPHNEVITANKPKANKDVPVTNDECW